MNILHLPALCICALSLPAGAITEAEDNLDKAPMPHESSGAPGAGVKVHLVSLRGYLVGQPDDTASLSRLHAEVQECVQRNSARGAASNPPRAWPDHINSQRLDTYAAINRTIDYKYGLAYAVNSQDCSLLEARFSKASLVSTQGICDIDLLAKTAHGACDASGHASAAPRARRPPAGGGERKTILGLQCEVRPNPFDAEGTICGSLGGSFAAPNGPGDEKQSGMLLEMTTLTRIRMRATKAQLDAQVSGAVFTPYLAGGFRITNTGKRP